MTIGVKFCGGCNPTYDRTAEYVKLKKRYPDIIFETYNPSKQYEKILLICGCERTCLRFREELTADEIIIPGSAQEMEEIRL